MKSKTERTIEAMDAGAIASAAILLNVKDRKIDKLEKELKDRSYNIEKE